MRAWTFAFLTFVGVFGPSPGEAQPFNTNGSSLAIGGYDPVAYFTEGRARLGNAAHSARHEGVVYRFVSDANQRKFEADPSRYLPRYGGYCAYGVAVGAKFDGDPRLFRIVDGKLYFNLNPEIQRKWEQDVAGNIVKADGNWPRIRDKAPEALQ